MEAGNLEDSINPKNPDAAYTHYGYQHGRYGCTQTPQRAGRYVHETADKVGERNVVEPDQPKANGFLRVRNVNAQQSFTKVPDGGSGNDTSNGHIENTDGKDLLDTLILVRAKVLTGKVHSRLMETVHQYIDKALNIGGRTVTGHQRIAVESVDRGLNDYIGYSKHGALNACG